MLREETWSFTNQHIESDDADMKTFNSPEKTKVMPMSTMSPARLGRRASKLVAEWQDRGLETLSGLTMRKLRLSFAPSQLVVNASAVG
jgi:hypothetical protein